MWESGSWPSNFKASTLFALSWLCVYPLAASIQSTQFTLFLLTSPKKSTFQHYSDHHCETELLERKIQYLIEAAYKFEKWTEADKSNIWRATEYRWMRLRFLWKERWSNWWKRTLYEHRCIVQLRLNINIVDPDFNVHGLILCRMQCNKKLRLAWYRPRMELKDLSCR